MNTTIRLDLENFINVVYKIYTGEFNDSNKFYFDHEWIQVKEEEVKKVRDTLAVYPDVNDDQIADSIYRLKVRNYESSYMDDYYDKAIEEIEEKIKQDFENLEGFFTSSDEVEVRGELKVDEIIWREDALILKGNIDKLESYIINCINGYGEYHYTIESFREAYEGNNIQQRIESHLGYLGHMESIYSSVFNFFRLKLDDIDANGSTEYTEQLQDDELID